MSVPIGKKVTEYMKNPGIRRLIIAVGAVGVALIVLSEILPAKEDAKPQDALTEQTDQTTEEYVAALEKRLQEVVQNMDGVGACRVMVTLENGVEYVYASEQKAGSDYSSEGDRLSQADDSESSVILIQTENGYEGLLITEMQPTVKGVIVVCEGGGDETVRQRVSEAVATVLDITSKHVCVVAGTAGVE